MATQLQVRRGTTSELQSFTGAEGEITVDTDKDTLVVHDGSTAGGHPLLRADAALGWTLTEHFVKSGTWTKTGKTGLKRIRVEAWGGGGSGGNGAASSTGGSGGGQGGHGVITIEVGSLTDNVSVTIGAGGASVPEASNTNGNDGGDTIFGSYMTVTGGEGGKYGNYDESVIRGTLGGRVTGTGVASIGDNLDSDGSGRLVGVIDLGGHAGQAGVYDGSPTYEKSGNGGGPGAGVVVGSSENVALGSRRHATGYCGAGGAGTSQDAGAPTYSGSGAQGSLIVYEIYGEV